MGFINIVGKVLTCEKDVFILGSSMCFWDDLLKMRKEGAP